ncbi:MAG TPA: exo-alpha-sialidase [Thermoanaerobaculia bacterium]|nr:exo-alpha-sialidase [Thermoanaerobaculia bacterium]
MATTHTAEARDGDVVLLVGTMKGAFLFRSDSGRGEWEMAGPWFQGEPVYALAYDGRAGRRRIWASPWSWHWGPSLRRSDDFGLHWTDHEATPIRFPEDSEQALKHVWQITPGREDEPEVLYCGVEPAAIFESRDGGDSWSLMRGLFDHPHRARWEPGAGGLCLHTIVPHSRDRERLLVAISTGGVYRSDDGGATWAPRNSGIRAQFLPEENRYPEFGQCVHKVAGHPARPDRLFLQNHWGLYRSEDGGDSWQDVANGVPSDFGFAMAVHPHDPDTVYIVPLESDEFRCTPEAKLRVYRSRDAGASWQPLAQGLPQEGAYETVLRDGLCTDTCGSAGVYFGTRSGKVWASRDEGDSWSVVADGLPPVVCVKAGVVG